MKGKVESFLESLLLMDRARAAELLHALGDDLSIVADQLIQPALEQLGELWQKGDAALAQVYMAGRICEELMDEMLPGFEPFAGSSARVAITVLDDYHLLGKRMICSMVRASGLGLLDYGRRTVEEIPDLVRRDQVELLLVSVLMLPSALQVKTLKQRLGDAGLGHVKVVVGGAPFRLDPELAREVGADDWGRDASDAVRIVGRFFARGGVQ